MIVMERAVILLVWCVSLTQGVTRGGCNVTDHSKLTCHGSSLSHLLHSVNTYSNYSLSVITVTRSNISFLPETTFARASSVVEVSLKTRYSSISSTEL